MENERQNLYFSFYTEIGVLAQLSRAAFETRLMDGVTMPHFCVLNHLIGTGDGITPLALARAFHVPKTSMTNTLSGLESRRLVAMRPNPKDGRSKCIWLTDKGRRFHSSSLTTLKPVLNRMADSYPADEIVSLVNELMRLRRFLESI